MRTPPQNSPGPGDDHGIPASRRARIYLIGMFLSYVLALVLIALAYQGGGA